MTPDGRCTSMEWRARAWLVALGLLGLAALGLACGANGEQEACRATCAPRPVATVTFGCSGSCVCAGAQPDGGAGR